MNEDALKLSIRKFLKMVGVTSQREIENAVREAIKAGRLPAGGKVKAKVVLTIGEVGLAHEVEDEIEVG